MQFLLFVVALAVVVGIVGFGAWAFARAFVYLSHQSHRGIVFALDRMLVPTVHLAKRTFAFARSATRSVEAVIVQRASAEQTEKSVEAEPAPVQMPKRSESEVDWDVYDIPTYLRRGKSLVW